MSVIIGVPVYKDKMNKYEEISFRQCCKVLKSYPICLITYESLNIELYNNIAKKYDIFLKTKMFDSSFFQDIYGYNKLCLSLELYDSFSEYDNLLIYQLDAFVFTDKLSYWCEKGFSYIGAPLPSKVLCNSSEKLSIILNKCITLTIGFNGGASLRHIESFREIIKHNQNEISLLQRNDFFEDIIFSYLFFKKQDIGYSQALRFSIESYPRMSFRQNKRKLPMLCHAWYKWDSEYYDNHFWYKFIIPNEYYSIKLLKLKQRVKHILQNICS